jgi:hypothetical protein
MAQNPRRDDPLQDQAAEWRLVLPSGTDWMDDEQWAAYLAADPADPGADPGPGPDPDGPPEFSRAELAAIISECRQIGEDEARAAAVAARMGTTGALAGIGATLGRRGPGLPGSAHQFAGEYLGPAGAFASGMILDAAPGGVELGLFAADAAGTRDRYPGASDDELIGAICAWDRTEAHAAARKHAAVAELIRRRPAAGCPLEGEAQMPAGWDEFTGDELSLALAESKGAAAGLLDLAWDLEVKLPGTRAAFRDGTLRVSKARIIADAARTLDPGQARAAEALVLDRAGRLTPGGLRAAIARAVMQVDPDAARKRREEAARDARVERWAEDSGNAALAGRELPPAEVLAADQRITWWAQQLKKAGLPGDMDELRARAYLDILLDKDSRPSPADPGGDGRTDPGGDGETGPGGDSSPGDGGPGSGAPPGPAPAGPRAGLIPAGFTGRVNLTIPLATLLDLADRPAELAGVGPIDPGLARDLARAAARNPRTAWCVTVTDQDGHAVGHGCARPQASGRAPPRTTGQAPIAEAGRPGFAFTAGDGHGPPGGYGTWQLSTGIAGQPEQTIALEPIATDQCDHRHQARGHDPGVKLRHLSEIRHATCTAPTCRRPATQSDFEHNIPFETGGLTCLCNGGPKCRHDHRVKQDPRWKVEQPTPAVIRWTTPSGRRYTTEPTRYPI